MRSDFMDEFARLEIAVGLRLKYIDAALDVRKVCFDQLVEKLANAKQGHRLSKKSVTDLAGLALDCEPFQHLRASMAHGVMEMAATAEGVLAIFRNAADVIGRSDTCYALTPAALQRHIDDLAAITRRIEGLSPSLQPPRARAAASGP